MPTPKSLTDLIRDIYPDVVIFKAKLPGAPKFLLQVDVTTQQPLQATEYEVYEPTLTEVATEITNKIMQEEADYIASFDPDPAPTFKRIVTYRDPNVWDDGLQYQVSVSVVQCIAVLKSFSDKVIEMPLKPA